MSNKYYLLTYLLTYKHNLLKIPGCGRALTLLTLPNQMTSVFSESNSCRITRQACQRFFANFLNYNIYAASDVLSMTTLSRYTLNAFTSRVDYCGSFLTGAPKKTTDKVQRVRNWAVRIVSNTRKFNRGDSLISGEVS